MYERRVVVTGMGAVCPLGRTVNELWDNLVEGKSSIRDMTNDADWIKNSEVRIGSFHGKDSMFGEFVFDYRKIGVDSKDVKKKVYLVNILLRQHIKQQKIQDF